VDSDSCRVSCPAPLFERWSNIAIMSAQFATYYNCACSHKISPVRRQHAGCVPSPLCSYEHGLPHYRIFCISCNNKCTVREHSWKDPWRNRKYDKFSPEYQCLRNLFIFPHLLSCLCGYLVSSLRFLNRILTLRNASPQWQDTSEFFCEDSKLFHTQLTGMVCGWQFYLPSN
jgi:hypothetical protein